MTKCFLKIRLIQLKREVGALGFFYTIFILGLFAFAGLNLYNQMNQYPNAIYATGFISSIILIIHINRKDKKFIATTVTNSKRMILMEYLSFSIPVFIIMLLSTHWYLVFLLILTYAVITFIIYKPHKKAGIIPFNRLIPTDNFEWIAGFKKYFWYILPIYTLAMGLLVVKFISLLFLWLLLGVISSFYQECEPLNIIQIKELPAKQYIEQKLKSHLKVYLIFSIPIIIGYSLFNTDTAWVAFIIYLLSIINLCLFILSKYSLYKPNINLTANSITNGIAMLSAVIPFLIPLPLIMCFREYRKSKSNLESYLNAYN